MVILAMTKHHPNIVPSFIILDLHAWNVHKKKYDNLGKPDPQPLVS